MTATTYNFYNFKNMNLSSLLKDSGLSEKQAKIYLSCLELGTTTAQAIAKRASVSRSTAYFVLEELAHAGLVTFFDKGNIRHFAAEDPKKLLDQSKRKTETLEQVFPELRRLWGQTQGKTSVRFFEGLENIKAMYNEILQLGLKEYWVFGSTEYWLKADEVWFKEYMRRRAAAGIKVKLILEDSPDSREQKIIEEQANGAQVRYMSKKFTKLLPPTSDATILPDRVIFQNYGREMTSTVFYSKETADLLRLWFMMTWEKLK